MLPVKDEVGPRQEALDGGEKSNTNLYKSCGNTLNLLSHLASRPGSKIWVFILGAEIRDKTNLNIENLVGGRVGVERRGRWGGAAGKHGVAQVLEHVFHIN